MFHIEITLKKVYNEKKLMRTRSDRTENINMQDIHNPQKIKIKNKNIYMTRQRKFNSNKLLIHEKLNGSNDRH